MIHGLGGTNLGYGARPLYYATHSHVWYVHERVTDKEVVL